MLSEVYQVKFSNKGKHFSHLFHTRWRAEKDSEDMKQAGCSDIKVIAYKTILLEVI